MTDLPPCPPRYERYTHEEGRRVNAHNALWWQSMAERLLELADHFSEHVDDSYDGDGYFQLSALRSAIASAGKEKV